MRHPEELAGNMASFAHKIHTLTIAAFENGTISNTTRDLHETFKKVLLPDLSVSQFADMLAQALTYGLFAARYNHSDASPFQRQDALLDTPRSNPFLHKLIDAITGPDLDDEPLVGVINDLAHLLAETDIQTVLAHFGRKGLIRAPLGFAEGPDAGYHTWQEDPLTHFYETFLEQYDPQLRDVHGVYYTPGPLVSYIVRSLDCLLRSHFACQDGLGGNAITGYTPTDGASEYRQIVLLDPACGTGTFLCALLKHMREAHRQAGKADTWSSYVRHQLLPHLYGLELLIAPYAIAHLKLSMQLAARDLPESERQTWAYDFEGDDRMHIYLANTLEGRCTVGAGEAGMWGGDACVALGGTHESKHRSPPPESQIMVVLGNPPYAGHSHNKSKWISMLLDTYKESCPELKKPAQAKWLSDDYVKFIRVAQWHIEQAGSGIMAFVTSHSYLDNPTFRGMRRSLLQSFDDIYIFDLHGNSKKKEKAPDGSKDENVFDIQQGAAIGIFVKWRNPQAKATQASSPQGGASAAPTVHHADIWGARETYERDEGGKAVLTGGKYWWLVRHDLANTQWTLLKPEAPLYLFTPQDTLYQTEYEALWSIPDIFQPHGDPAPGIITCHDQFAISWSRDEAIQKVERLLSTHSEDEARQLFRLCKQDQWQYARAKECLEHGAWRQEIVEVLYRPFDKRWTIFNRHVAVHRRERVMRHMLAEENVGLTIGRSGQVIDQGQWDIVFCTRHITEFNLYRRGGNNLFPLYLYSSASGSGKGSRRASLAPAFFSDVAARLRMAWVPDGRGDLEQTFGPEDVFSYMYAVFHSPTYRQRYAQFLKRDFPHLPLTSNVDLFRALCNLGARLVTLHLKEDPGRATQVSSPNVHIAPAPTGACASPGRATQASSPTEMAEALRGRGDNHIETVRYEKVGDEAEKGRVWINATQYFDDIPLATWNFSIGGYQVCQKWLKDRKGRTLSEDEVMQYQQIIAILSETVHLMQKIDETIAEHGGWPISLPTSVAS